ncbi:hypothetical protein PYCCODRAFT_341714 [Trametes coccinea BRFM310]|uniref:Uncharacterized protein n=1 Tax=Trametes coccinea (strain BRFM310) TaxID=1353009 RepID=A0A1Y2J2Q9_TRAC3|nr:hypothetical protein PYCCODRAFT_341714 [Trametes coccinea BRFM310]
MTANGRICHHRNRGRARVRTNFERRGAILTVAHRLRGFAKAAIAYYYPASQPARPRPTRTRISRLEDARSHRESPPCSLSPPPINSPGVSAALAFSILRLLFGPVLPLPALLLPPRSQWRTLPDRRAHTILTPQLSSLSSSHRLQPRPRARTEKSSPLTRIVIQIKLRHRHSRAWVGSKTPDKSRHRDTVRQADTPVRQRGSRPLTSPFPHPIWQRDISTPPLLLTREICARPARSIRATRTENNARRRARGAPERTTT